MGAVYFTYVNTTSNTSYLSYQGFANTTDFAENMKDEDYSSFFSAFNRDYYEFYNYSKTDINSISFIVRASDYGNRTIPLNLECFLSSGIKIITSHVDGGHLFVYCENKTGINNRTLLIEYENTNNFYFESGLFFNNSNVTYSLTRTENRNDSLTLLFTIIIMALILVAFFWFYNEVMNYNKK